VSDHEAIVGRVADATSAALRRSLDAQREHALGIVDGLTAAQLREPRLPSGWNCLGLINHLALDGERYWFTCIMGGEPFDAHDDDATSNWPVSSESSPGRSSTVVERRSRRRTRSSSLDLAGPPTQRDPWWGEWDVPDLRFVLLLV
jgi:Protein of unknown function (DUF664)